MLSANTYWLLWFK